MKFTKLKHFPSIQTYTLVLLLMLPLGVYTYTQSSQEAYDALYVRLNEISVQPQQLLGEPSTDNKVNLARLDQYLAAFAIIDAYFVMSNAFEVLAYGGDDHLRSLNPRQFQSNNIEFIALEQRHIFILPINKTHFWGWVILSVSPEAIASIHSQALSHALWTCLIFLIASLVTLQVYKRKQRALVNNAKRKANAIYHLKRDNSVNVSEFEELSPLAKRLFTLSQKLNEVEASMALEIQQTTEDLRETLETIEIQNVELDLARKDAVLANRTKSEFLANMSHEVRTPLNGIIGFTNLLLKSSLNQRQKDHLLTIRKSSEILLLIINDILDFSKIEAGKLLLDSNPLNLRELIDEVVIMLAPTAHEKNLELIHLHYQDVPKTIMGDPLRIKQVVTNLVNNAIKFTQAGEVIVRAMIDEDDRVRITVSDTGVGLSGIQQHSIFKAFSQADASTARNFGGTGLGLTISKKLIEQMKGNIGFDSELGKGSTFWFSLPTVEAETLPSDEGIEEIHLLQHMDILCFEPIEHAHFAIEHLFRAWQVNYSIFPNLETLIQRADKKTTTFAIDRLFQDWQNNTPAKTHYGPDSHETSSETHSSAQGRSHITILCFNGKACYLKENLELIKQLQKAGQKILVITPTMESYEAPAIQAASSHLVKPLTHNRLLHALLELAAPENEPAAEEDETQLSLRNALNNLPVLVVDDNEINLNLMMALLEGLNIEAYGASDGYEAIELCKQKQFSIIFMDIQMPGMDGVQAMQKIRQINPTYESTNIIALTAYALPKEKEDFLNQGFQHLITKPIDEAQLLNVLNQCAEGGEIHTVFTPSNPSSEITPDDNAETEASAKVVDIAEAIHLSNGNEALAKDLMKRFLLSLPEQKNEIKRLFETNAIDQLERTIHKLHGACHYCGVPILRAASLTAEHALKTKQSKIDDVVEDVLSAIDMLKDWHDSEVAYEWLQTKP